MQKNEAETDTIQNDLKMDRRLKCRDKTIKRPGGNGVSLCGLELGNSCSDITLK